MKILLIIDQLQNKEYFLNILNDISERNLIITLHTIEEGANFIHKSLLLEQMELDLIIIQDKWQNKSKGVEFIDTLIRNSSQTYSNRDFNLKALPFFILISQNKNDEYKEDYLKEQYFEESQLIGQPEKLELYLSEIVSRVKNWRKKLLDELSNFGIEYKNGYLDYPSTKNLFKNITTEILSDNFKIIRRRLNYVWLNKNNSQIEQSIDEFIKELKWSERNKSKDEKKFHTLFRKYPLFLSRDVYNNQWYEPRLKYTLVNGEKKYIEPDFILKRNFRKDTDLSVLEIKLPQEGFMKNSNFHPSPLSSFMNHLFQVSDYKDYLENEQNSKVICDYFGFKPIKFDYNLLIGREDNKQKQSQMFELRLNQMNMEFIKIITYDNLLELQVRFLQRLKILEIK
jgi:hypothetical protein